VKRFTECKVEKKFTEFQPDEINKRIRKYQQLNKGKIKDCSKEYYKTNEERIRENILHRRLERRRNDPLFRLKCNLRSRTSQAFRNKGYNKNTRTQEMLGVDWKVCKKHIERQFTKSMSWNNYGDWHIDHIIPLTFANTIEELKKLCHYSNLQPLWAVDNLMKSNKINGQQTLLRI
tara:strand:- start:78 stop:605 length:528 start_codon:yes stop_codon:yes gene_type:complete